MKEIALGDGYFAKVDDEDFEKINIYKWVYVKQGKRVYARQASRLTLMHRRIIKCKDDQLVDHINGDGLDNTKANLRLCNNTQNSQNRRNSGKGNTPFKGVYFHTRDNKFRSRITVDKRMIHLGNFDCPFKAARAYDEAAKIHFGEFANLNFNSQ